MAGKRIAVFSLFALLALTLAVFASSGTEAQTYNPYNSYTVTSAGAGDAADSLNTIGIAAPDLNYEDSSMFSINPVDWVLVNPSAIAIGAGMGVLDANVAVGMFGQGCNQALHPIFNLYNASVNNAPANILGPADMYWMLKNKDDYPVPRSKWNAQLPDYLEGYPHFVEEMLDPDGSGPKPSLKPVARYAGHGVVANMNILIQFVVLDPGQLTELGGVFTQLGAAVGRPNIIILNNPVSQEEAPGAISDFCTPLKTVTTLYATTTDNPDTTTVNESGTSAQTNPAASTGVLGTGTHMARNYSMSERDADGDGFENDLDPCHYTSDVGWDPRVSGAQPGFDSDDDHLPDSCDPDPNGAGDPDPVDCAGAQTDCDDDGYDNAQDICPLVANGCKTSSCGPKWNAAWDNQADDDNAVASADLGPRPDSIGNACDDSDDDGLEAGGTATPGSGNCTDGIDNDLDGKTDVLDPECVNDMDKAEIALGHTPAQIWGTSPGTGSYHHGMPWAAVCIGATDTDGDGYCNLLESMLGSNPNNGAETAGQCANATDDETGTGASHPEDPSCVNDIDDDAADDGATPRINDGCPTKGAPEDSATQCNDSLDQDGDTRVNDGCPAVNAPENPACANDTDDDGDTIPNDGCPQKGPAVESACNDAVDDDGDTNVNDGCPTVGDGYANDGCPQVGKYIETGTECLNATSDDTDVPNLCDGGTTGGPDCTERTLGVKVNDGCPVIGVPESLVIDVQINAPAALPQANVPQSCSDGVDNDGDTLIDGSDPLCIGMNPVDTDKDGLASTNPCEGMMPGDAGGAAVGPVTVTKGGGTGNASDLCLIFKNGAGLNSPVLNVNPCAGAPTDLVAGTNDAGENAVWLNCGAPDIAPGEAPQISFKATTPPTGGFWITWTLTGDPLPTDNCSAVWNPTLTNSDADSYGNACDNCPTFTSEDQTNTDRDVLEPDAWLQTGGKNAWYSDPLGDVCDNDDDNDFYSDTIETYLGTNPLDNCPKPAGPGTGGDSWPLDINATSDLSVTGDVFNYINRIGAKSGPNAYCPGPLTGLWLQRLDLNKSCDLSVTGDVFQYVGRIGDKCN